MKIMHKPFFFFFANQFLLVFVYLMCVPKHLFFHLVSLCSPETPKGWTPLTQMFLEEMIKLKYGHQSQQRKDLVQLEIYYHLVFLFLFLSSANLILVWKWRQRRNSRVLEPGGRSQIVNISIFHMFPYTIVTGSKNQETPMRVPGKCQKGRHSVVTIKQLVGIPGQSPPIGQDGSKGKFLY